MSTGQPEYMDNPKGLRQRAPCGCWVWASEEDGGWDERPYPPSWSELEESLERKLKMHLCERGLAHETDS